MPQIKSRKKDLRQARAKHQRNLGVKRAYKTAVRAARELGQVEQGMRRNLLRSLSLDAMAVGLDRN